MRSLLAESVTSTVVAGDGLAVVGCSDCVTGEPRSVSMVDLRSGRATELIPPVSAGATMHPEAVGQRWIYGTFEDGTGVYLNRATREIRMAAAGSLDPDTADLAPLRRRDPRATTLLHNGNPYVATGNISYVAIDDPRLPGTRVLHRGCHATCGKPSGTFARTVFTVGLEVWIVHSRKPPTVISVPTRAPDPEHAPQDYLTAAATRSRVIVSRQGAHAIDVLVARA